MLRSFRWQVVWRLIWMSVALAVGWPGTPVGASGPEEPPRRSLGLRLPTLGGLQFWADELFFHDWRVQRRAGTGGYRLLDGNLVEYASGSYQQCLAALGRIRAERHLPPMRGKAVLLLHGLGRTRFSMSPLAKYLESHSDYSVFNVGYPSTRAGIADHARSLAHIMDHLDGIEEINLVAHSLGNIVVRRYLADQTDPATGRRPDPRIKRIVMLAPPNHGSILATELAENPAFQVALGASAQQLGRQWVWTEESLATPTCQFGIVAGGLGNDHGLNPLLPGDDDGVVTVQSTRLLGARDMVTVPTLHSVLMLDPRVHQYTLRFLQHGYFISEARRQPVTGE